MGFIFNRLASHSTINQDLITPSPEKSHFDDTNCPDQDIYVRHPERQYNLLLCCLAVILLLPFIFFIYVYAKGGVSAPAGIARFTTHNALFSVQLITILSSFLSFGVAWTASRAITIFAQKRILKSWSIFELEVWSALRNGMVLLTWKTWKESGAMAITVIAVMLGGLVTSGFVSLISPLPIQVDGWIGGGRELNLASTSKACIAWYQNQTSTFWSANECSLWETHNNFTYTRCPSENQLWDVLHAGKAAMMAHVSKSENPSEQAKFVSSYTRLNQTRILGSTGGTLPLGQAGLENYSPLIIPSAATSSILNVNALSANYNYTLPLQGLWAEVSCRYVDNFQSAMYWQPTSSGTTWYGVLCPGSTKPVGGEFMPTANGLLASAACEDPSSNTFTIHLRSFLDLGQNPEVVESTVVSGGTTTTMTSTVRRTTSYRPLPPLPTNSSAIQTDSQVPPPDPTSPPFQYGGGTNIGLVSATDTGSGNTIKATANEIAISQSNTDVASVSVASNPGYGGDTSLQAHASSAAPETPPPTKESFIATLSTAPDPSSTETSKLPSSPTPPPSPTPTPPARHKARQSPTKPEKVYAGIDSMECKLSPKLTTISAKFRTDLAGFLMVPEVDVPMTAKPPVDIIQRAMSWTIIALHEAQTQRAGNFAAALVNSVGVSHYHLPGKYKDDRYPELVAAMIKGIYEYQGSHLRLVLSSSDTPAPEECLRSVEGTIKYQVVGWDGRFPTLPALIPLAIICIASLYLVLSAARQPAKLPLFDPTNPMSLIVGASNGGITVPRDHVGAPQDELVRDKAIRYGKVCERLGEERWGLIET